MRARDAERAAVAEALGEAYSDGQLTDAEHTERVDAALKATKVAELDALLADLRGEAIDMARDILDPAREEERRRAAEQARRRRRERRRARIVGFSVLALVVGGGVAGVYGIVQLVNGDSLADNEEVQEAVDDLPGDISDEVRSALESGQLGDVDPDVIVEQAGQIVSRDDVDLASESPEGAEVSLPGIDRWAVTEDNVTTLIADWQEAKGPYFTGLSFYDTWAGITLPVAATLPRDEDWTVDQDGTATLSTTSQPQRGAPVMDLRDLDVGRLFTNVEAALGELEVSDAVVLYIAVDFDVITSLPKISIYVTNAYEEVAYLTTSLGGAVLGRYPFTA